VDHRTPRAARPPRHARRPVGRRPRAAGLLAALSAAAVAAPAAVAPAAATAALPDGRAYELVSPADKGGQSPTFQRDLSGAVTPDGGRAALWALTPFPGAPTGTQTRGVMERTADGWRTTYVGPRDLHLTTANLPAMGAISDDLATWVVRARCGGILNNCDTDADLPGAVDFLFGRYDVPDLQTIPRYQPEPGAQPSGVLRTIGGEQTWIANGTVEPATAQAVIAWGPQRGFTALSEAPGVPPAQWCPASMAYPRPVNDYASLGGTSIATVSADGTRVFFDSTGVDGSCGVRRAYVRDAGPDRLLGTGDDAIAEVSRSQLATPDAQQAVTVLGASEDGSTVWFTTAERLTDDDGGTQVDIYRWRGAPTGGGVAGGTVTRLTRGDDPARQGTSPRLVSASRDGSVVTFFSDGVLLPGMTTTGAFRLDYYVHDEHGLRAVVDLQVSWIYFVVRDSTPDGRYTLIQTTQRLTGTRAAGTQLYRYDRETGETLCIACDVAPTGSDAVAAKRLAPEALVRIMTDDGRRVYFNSEDGISPRDTNDANDVYEWRDGVVSLISGGADVGPSQLYSTTPSGDDVFFLTPERLVGWDGDSQNDIYDARVGGGFPEPPAGDPAQCEGDGCRPGGNRPPDPPLPGSETYRGPEELAPERAAAAYRLRPVGAAQRRRLARGRAATVVVETTQAGRLRAVVRARVGRRAQRVAAATAVARAAGTTRLRVRLSRAARRQLKRSRRLRVTVVVSYSRVRGTQRRSCLLRTRAGSSR